MVMAPNLVWWHLSNQHANRKRSDQGGNQSAAWPMKAKYLSVKFGFHGSQQFRFQSLFS